MDDQRRDGEDHRQTRDGHVSRRRYLRAAAGASGLAATTGCLGLGSPGGPDTYLAAPDREFDPSALPYPTHGDPLPNATVPAPLDDTAVSTGQLDTDVLLTFFYSHCQTVCPRLVSTLRDVQTRATEEGYGADVVFLATTFDPERDTEQRLRAYADRMNVDRSTGDWHFLRPAPGDRTKQVVTETFGVAFQREEVDDHGGGSGTASEGAYGFVHSSLILLANADGYVERAYRETQPVWQDVYDDLATLREREG